MTFTSDQKQVVFASGKFVHVKALQPVDPSNQWKAHDALVMSVAVDQVCGTIVSVGEDCKYKLWDKFGKLLYSSNKFSDSPQSVIWHPSGSYFVVGLYDRMLLCNSSGHLLSSTYLEGCGSIYDLDWNSSATHISVACGNGSICLGAVDEIPLISNQFEVFTYNSSGKVIVKDSVDGITETLDVKRAVLCSALGFNHLVVVTLDHVYVYKMKQWNTPLIIDCSKMGQVIDVCQTHGYFAIIDNMIGIQVYSYEGRLVSTIKHALIQPDYLTRNMVSLSVDGVAVISTKLTKSLLLFDISGRPVGDQPVFTHNRDIQKIMIEQSPFVFGSRLIGLLDHSSSLYVLPTSIASASTGPARQEKQQQSLSKLLSSFVTTFAWDQNSSTICSVSDTAFKVWYYPSALTVDEDLSEFIAASSSDTNSGLEFPSGNWQNSQIMAFSSTTCVLRRTDGAIGYVAGIKSFPAVLAQLAKNRDWPQSIKTCRFINQKELWACLAALSLQLQEYETAEVAYAALEDVKKVKWVCLTKEDRAPESRQAEQALFRKIPSDAETILLGSGQIFRSIYTWIELYQWTRALDIAIKYNRYLDIVLYLRAKYLNELDQEEMNSKFISQFEKVEEAFWNDPEAIETRLDAEKQKLPKHLLA